MTRSQQLDRLMAAIDRLRVDFERFFNGALATPPEELREQIRRQIRRLRADPEASPAERFRLSSIEARFNSFNDLFQRRLRDHEEGRSARSRTPSAQEPRYDPGQGVVVGEDMAAPAVEALYTGLSQSAGAGPRFDLESFRTYLARQVTSIRDKTGCSRVQFRLSEEGGKMKLKARPVRGSEASRP